MIRESGDPEHYDNNNNDTASASSLPSSSSTSSLLSSSASSTPNYNNSTFIAINVRFTTGETQRFDNVNINNTVQDFKQLIMNSTTVKDLRGKFIRLIYHGRFLQPETSTLRSFHIKNDSFIHCTVSDQAPPQQQQQQQQQVQHRSNNTSNSNDDDPPLRGFDRLRESGFSEEEIHFIRTQFYVSRQHLLQNAMQQQPGFSVENLRQMEEEWMNNEAEFGQGMDTSVTINDAAGEGADLDDVFGVEGTNLDLFMGIFLGFMLGFFMLLWLWERAVPRKQKIGILAGIGCNLSFALLKVFIFF